MIMKILAIVPSFNEAENIIHVIESIREENPLIDILVVNDCSKDKTGALAESTGQASVVNLPSNLGIGGAVQTGFKYAMRKGYDIAFQFDGDGQHLASEIKILLDPILHNEADVVIGSRFCEKQNGFRSTPLRRRGIKVFEILNSLLIKQKITDNTSGFRAYCKKPFTSLQKTIPTTTRSPRRSWC